MSLDWTRHNWTRATRGAWKVSRHCEWLVSNVGILPLRNCNNDREII